MAKIMSELEKDIRRMNQQSRRDMNEILAEYVSLYNRLEADAVDPVLYDQQIEEMEERMRMMEKWFVGMFLGSQGYSLQYDEKKRVNQYQKTGRAKEF
jgi:Spy/CpxP family protein refolding chaperone